MQVLNRRGMNGLPQDIVRGADGMLGSPAVEENCWPYWWEKPQAHCEPVQRILCIPTPAQGVQTVVVSLIVPAGFMFVMKGMLQNFATGNNPSPFVDGSGDILWTIDVDIPIGATNLSGYPIADFSNMQDERGSKLGPWEVPGYRVFEQYQHLRYKVTTSANIPVGAPNFIRCGLFGWWEKMIQPQK